MNIGKPKTSLGCNSPCVPASSYSPRPPLGRSAMFILCWARIYFVQSADKRSFLIRQHSLNFQNTGLAPFGEIVFPNPHNPPVQFAQVAVHVAVTGLVANNLSIPILFIGTWPAIALRATMPETSVHKHRDFLPAENKIRFSKNWLIPPPTSNAVFLQ